MGVVTEIKKANGEVMRIIDGEYVIGASSGCFSSPKPCRKVINGEYLVEGECESKCKEEVDCLGFDNITVGGKELITISENKFNELKAMFNINECDYMYIHTDYKINGEDFDWVPVARFPLKNGEWEMRYYEYTNAILIKENSIEEAKEFFIVTEFNYLNFFKKIRCKDAN